jgi:hypothetical protein
MLKSLINLPGKTEPVYKRNMPLPAERLVTYYELYKLISHLNGSIIKCGISVDEAFGYFSFFQQQAHLQEQPMVSFEKNAPLFEKKELNGDEVTFVKPPTGIIQQIELVKKGRLQNIDHRPGLLTESIPNYLIENPELKIALLTIDLDDFENTLTTMQYLYPRIVQGGVLILNNYHKKQGECEAVKDYFYKQEVIIRHFSLTQGPYYIVVD